jgi:hypothetical protein
MIGLKLKTPKHKIRTQRKIQGRKTARHAEAISRRFEFSSLNSEFASDFVSWSKETCQLLGAAALALAGILAIAGVVGGFAGALALAGVGSGLARVVGAGGAAGGAAALTADQHRCAADQTAHRRCNRETRDT